MILRTPTIDLSALRLPDRIDAPGLLVGWSMEQEPLRRPVGFNYGDPDHTPSSGFVDPIQLSPDGHLMTIAPTGAGKGTGCIIPALLKHEGPVIVIDPKGENVAVTARRRREMGHRVVVIDPMKVTDFASDALNPLDLIDCNSPMVVDEVVAIVRTLGMETPDRRDQFWHSSAENLLVALILHVLADWPPGFHNLGAVRTLLQQLPGAVAAASEDQGTHDKASDTLLNRLRSSKHSEVRRLAAILLTPARETFGGIAAFAEEMLGFLRGEPIRTALSRTTFPLDFVTLGAPLSIYLVLPPHMLESHGKLLRIWVSALMQAITRRQRKPEQNTLFILDEAAQLGPLAQLRQAITLLRGYGLQTWSFWQDRSQLERLYPKDWRTMVNNCRVLQCFGALNMHAAQGIAEMTGFELPERVLDLRPDEMVLQLAGDEAVIARVPNYLTDPLFAGLFDPNPYYDPSRPIMRPEHRSGRRGPATVLE